MKVKDVIVGKDKLNLFTNKPAGLFSVLKKHYSNSPLGNYMDSLSTYYFTVHSAHKPIRELYFNMLKEYIDSKAWFQKRAGSIIDGKFVAGETKGVSIPFPRTMVSKIAVTDGFESVLYAVTKSETTEDGWYYTKIEENKFIYEVGRDGDDLAKFGANDYIAIETSYRAFDRTTLELNFGYSYFNFMSAQSIISKFDDSWTKIYNALIQSQYNTLDEFSRTKTGNSSKTIKTEFGSSLTHSIDTTDSVQHGKKLNYGGSVTDVEQYEGSFGRKSVEETSDSTDASRYGFNSVNAVPTDKDVTTGTVTVTEDENDNVDNHMNKNTKTYNNSETFSGTDTHTETGTKTDTKSGEDTDTHADNFTENISGRDKPASELIEMELNFRNRTYLFDIISRDIDSVIALSVY